MTITVFLGSMLAAMALGIPIAFSLLLCGAALMWHLNMFDAQILAQNVINGADSFPLLAVPFFILAGNLMNNAGITNRIYNYALALVVVQLITDCSYDPLNSSQHVNSISSRPRPMQIFLPNGPRRPTSMSVPRCPLSRKATMAPRKVNQTKSQRESSSDTLKPELKA